MRSQPVQAGFLPLSSASRPALVERCITPACTLVSSTSRARVDLPEPDTPVTATSRYKGTVTEMSCRLCRSALTTLSHDVNLLAAAGAALCSALAPAAAPR